MITPDRVLLAGIVGSTAYGLAGEGSDIDRLGVFAEETGRLLGLHRPKSSHVSTRPDRTLHEAAKWLGLALAGNPTAMELVWLPADLYEVRTALGDELIALRGSLLSAPRVRDAYLGYAGQQLRRLAGRAPADVPRLAKQARYLARLAHQGLGLYRTGRLTIRLADPQWYLDFGEKVAAGDLEPARTLLAETERAFAETTTPLPDAPDEEPAQAWLAKVRQAHYTVVPTGRRFLVDLDGTLALRDEADPRVRRFYDWHRVGEDLPNPPVVTVVRALAAAGHSIVYVSGRSEQGRAATSAWIAAHVGVQGEALHMRPRGDSRPDYVVKRELYERHVLPGEVTGVLDDRNSVVAMWRELGLTVFQVAEGDF